MKDMTSRLMQDAADRDQRLAERDQRMLEQLGGFPIRWKAECRIWKHGCKINKRCSRKVDGKNVHGGRLHRQVTLLPALCKTPLWLPELS